MEKISETINRYCPDDLMEQYSVSLSSMYSKILDELLKEIFTVAIEETAEGNYMIYIISAKKEVSFVSKPWYKRENVLEVVSKAVMEFNS